jgi:hypothetical protein
MDFERIFVGGELCCKSAIQLFSSGWAENDDRLPRPQVSMDTYSIHSCFQQQVAVLLKARVHGVVFIYTCGRGNLSSFSAHPLENS